MQIKRSLGYSTCSKVFGLILSSIALSGCLVLGSKNEDVVMIEKADSSNVLLHKSPLDYFAPEFDKIDTSMYEPAFLLGLEQHTKEIKAIANNPQPPTFENTIVALEQSGELLNRALKVFFSLSVLNSNEKYQQLETQFAPVFSQHNDDIFLNGELFGRVKALYGARDQLEGEQQRLVDFYYGEFVRSGAQLGAEEQARMRQINSELSTLNTEFSQHVQAAYSDDLILVKDQAELNGLSEGEIAALADAAESAGKTGYAITLVNTTRQPVLKSLKNRELREKIWRTSAMRAQENNSIVLSMVKLRAEKASLLGYPNWAAYVLADQMAGTPSEVFAILDDLAPQALHRAKGDAADIEALMSMESQEVELQPWDWEYYAEKVRQQKYDLDEQLVKPYFELSRVVNDGLFYAMNKLYGITMKPRPDLPVWNEDVTAYEVFEEGGASIGLYYLDPYAREGKRGGAWMDELVTQSHLFGTKPVVYNVVNIPKPAHGQPTLMTMDEVFTLFHEFGHALHGLFSDVTYPSLAGTATARDFVEFPSQFNEDWLLEPQVLAHYARHYQSGEPISKELLKKVLAARTFNQGFDTTEYLAAALLDMEWHSLSENDSVDSVEQFEAQALKKHNLLYTPIPPRYKSDFFSHIFDGGYSASYYAYLWTEVLAADAFAYLKANGGLNRANGDRYRQYILSRGNTRDLMQNYVDFRGQKPVVEALLIRRGLVEEKMQ